MEKRTSKPLLLFYLLVAYVIIQFLWWSFILFKLNSEVADLKKEMIGIRENSLKEKQLEEIDAHLRTRQAMIAGEGAVFLLLLVFGFYKVRQSFRKEAELARMQKNFMLSVTHELRSPLASVKLQIETLMRRELDKERTSSLLKGAMADSERLENLVENILVASQLEDNRLRIHREPGDLSSFVSAILEKISFTIRKNHNFISDIEEDISFSFDRVTFPSIVINLIENAAKYSPAGTTVSLSLKKIQNRIRLRVSDEGPGIPSSERENIFRKFYRIGNEETRSAKGTGLGLFIVKSIVKLHGGEISVQSNSPKGTVFNITFNT